MELLYFLIAVFIFLPFIPFILIVFAVRKRLRKRSVGFAADVTTFLLFLSVPVSMEALWDWDTMAIVFFIAIIIAIAVLIIEWRRTKELEIVTFIRKTWRLYFLLLCSAYFLIWMAGLVLTVREFMIS